MGWREEYKYQLAFSRGDGEGGADIIMKIYNLARKADQDILIVGQKNVGEIEVGRNESWISYVIGEKFVELAGKYKARFLGALRVQRSPRQIVAETFFMRPENLPLRVLDSVVVKKLYAK